MNIVKKNNAEIINKINRTMSNIFNDIFSNDSIEAKAISF